MRQTVHFQGVITTISALTFTPPSTNDPRRNNGGIKGDTHTLPTLNGSLFFPSTGIRGKLRRIAVEVARKSLSEQIGDDYKFTLEDFFMATLGGVKQGKGGDKNKPDEGGTEDVKQAEDAGVIDVRKLRYVRENNPVLSLFGAMAPLTVPGLAEIGHGMCTDGVKPEVIRYARTNELIRNADAWEVLDADAYNKLSEMVIAGKKKTAANELIKSLKAKAAKAEGVDRDSLNAEITSLTDAKKSDGTVNIMHPGLNYQVIPPGTAMNFRMTLKNANEQEISLFLRTLGVFGFYPVLGSHVAHGCGLVSMKLDVSVQKEFSLKKVGEVRIDGDFTGMQMTEGVEAMVVPLKLNAEAFKTSSITKL